jgi:hypothetical protein
LDATRDEGSVVPPPWQGEGVPGRAAETDAIIATPSPTKMPQITFVAGNLDPGVYFDACNLTTNPIDPQPFTVRVNTIGA